jgi:MoaA/NifB/PqqE/SkfB family radical SAM enzyme
VKLHTNGPLFTPDAWIDLGPVRSRVSEVEVSIDAATAATYAANRRGGDWEALLQRLGFISTLRRNHDIDCVQISFVIQSNNWREMAAFVDLGESFGVDRILFTALRNWGTFAEAEYRRRAVHRPDHPEHDEFVRSLSCARPRGPGVTLGDVERLRPAEPAGRSA